MQAHGGVLAAYSLTPAKRYARLSVEHDKAHAAYEALAVRVADGQAAAEAALAVADMAVYDERSASLSALRGELERQGERVSEIARQRDLANVERIREEHTARLAEAEKNRLLAEHEIEQHLAELGPLVEALRATVSAGRAAEEKVAAHRAEVHGLRMTLGEIPNGEPLRWTYRPVIELLRRNPSLDELSAHGIR